MNNTKNNEFGLPFGDKRFFSTMYRLASPIVLQHFIIFSLGMVDVMMGERDVLQPDILQAPKIVQPLAHRLIIREAAVYHHRLASIRNQVDHGGERPGVKPHIDAKGMNAGGDLHGNPLFKSTTRDATAIVHVAANSGDGRNLV